jgi:hypothetical protein
MHTDAGTKHDSKARDSGGLNSTHRDEARLDAQIRSLSHYLRSRRSVLGPLGEKRWDVKHSGLCQIGHRNDILDTPGQDPE